MRGGSVYGHTVVTGQDMPFCLQGVPGIKGDRGEPGQRGLDGSPVSLCHRPPCARIGLLQCCLDWSLHCLGLSRGGWDVGTKRDHVASNLFSPGSTRRAWCGRT